jgi:hypothetical protein
LVGCSILDSDDDDEPDDEGVEDVGEPLEDRLAGVDLDDSDKVWACLSEAEKAEFRNLITSSEAAEKLMPPWEPWWTKA